MISFFKKKNDSDYWKITDYIISVDELLYHCNPTFESDFIKEEEIYSCIRNLQNELCIYIQTKDIKFFETLKEIYDKKKGLINLTEIERYSVDRDIFSEVLLKAVPPDVAIKSIMFCNVKGIKLFVYRKYQFTDERLANDLISLASLKNKHNLS